MNTEADDRFHFATNNETVLDIFRVKGVMDADAILDAASLINRSREEMVCGLQNVETEDLRE